MAEKHSNGPNRRNDYASSNRRKFLIGAGSVAAGGSALLGTAATTTFNLNDRGVNANVVTDSSGAVALNDLEAADAQLINGTSSGELEINFTNGTASGVNVGSTVEIGKPTEPSSDAAFNITNQTTDVVDIKFEFVSDSGFVCDASTLEFFIENHTPADGDGIEKETLTIDSSLNPDTARSVSFLRTAGLGGDTGGHGLSQGDDLDVAIKINADVDGDPGSNTGENLSGVLNITATQGSDTQV